MDHKRSLVTDTGLDLLRNRFFWKFGWLEDPNMEVFGYQDGDYERTMSATREELKTLIFLVYFQSF